LPLPETITSAAEACAEIEAWLTRRRRRKEPDWPALLGEIRRRLSQICAADLVRNDPEAQAILEDMTRMRGMEALDENVDRLGLRVRQLVAERDGVAVEEARPRSFLRSPLAQSSRDEALEAPSRTFLRL
jgi:hypothetical protein